MKSILELANRKDPATAQAVRVNADESSVGKGVSGGRSCNNVVMHIGKNGVSENHEIAISHSDPSSHSHLSSTKPTTEIKSTTPQTTQKSISRSREMSSSSTTNIMEFIVKCPAS